MPNAISKQLETVVRHFLLITYYKDCLSLYRVSEWLPANSNMIHQYHEIPLSLYAPLRLAYSSCAWYFTCICTMLRYFHGILFPSFATTCSIIYLGFATDSYFRRDKQDTLFYLNRRHHSVTTDKMAIQNQVKTPFQVCIPIYLPSFLFYIYDSKGGGCLKIPR